MPDLAAFCSTWDLQYEYAAEPIDPGETVQGFSLVGNTLDNSPKLYAYETAEDGYSSLTGYVAAIGFTVPVMVNTEATLWGGVKALYR